VNTLPIYSESETRQRAMTDILFLAREQQLSTYDASYLDLAMRQGIPIATLDKNLMHAAKRCQVALIGEA